MHKNVRKLLDLIPGVKVYNADMPLNIGWLATRIVGTLILSLAVPACAAIGHGQAASAQTVAISAVPNVDRKTAHFRRLGML